jgi:cell division protein ZapA (FtsZ GTPase activity inhibitor)
LEEVLEVVHTRGYTPGIAGGNGGSGVALVDITITLEPFMEELQLQVKEMLEEIVQLLTTLVVVVELEELVLVLQRFLMEE